MRRHIAERVAERMRDAAPSAQPSLAPNGLIGKYRLLEEVGRGAVGVVFRAEDVLSGEAVAVKAILASTAAQEATYSRLFFNEVRANRLLRHPNIVPILDAGCEGACFYVVMEFVPGSRTLESVCSAGSLLPVPEVLELAVDCAEALHYAHGKGVIHRDVKPGNVLLDRRRRARITDFGVAVLGEGGLADTSPFAAAGSPLYMAPEQIRADPITPAADLFALGLVTYQLLAGHHPFTADSLAAVAHRLLEDEAPPLDTLRMDLPEGLSDLVAATLAKSPAQRPGTGLALARSFSALIGGARRPLEGLVAEGRAEQLRRVDFFRDFGDAELWELLRWAHWEEVACDTEVVSEGADGESFYVIVEGEVVVGKGGRPVATLGPGACFGEIAYLSEQPRSASVIARGRCRLLRVDGSLLQGASVRCQMEFQRAVIRVLAARLVETTDALVAGG